MRALLATAPVVVSLVASLVLSSVAVAADVVVPPLVPRGGTEVRDVANITQLISSELDFMPEIDNVVELNKVPPGFGVSCLDSATCLRGVGQTNGTSHVFAGKLRVSDTEVTLDLVYFDVKRGRFVRRKNYTLTNRPEVIADGMDEIVREMVTGEAPKSDDDASAGDMDLLDFDDELDVDFDADDFAEAAADEEARKRQALEDERKRKEEARRKAEVAARERAEREAREAREAEARRQREEEARRLAAAEEKRRAEAEARAARLEAERRAEREEEERIAAARRRAEAAAAAAEPDPEPEFDPSMISFGSAEIQIEGEPEPVADEPIVTRRAVTPSYYDEPDDEPIEIDDEPAIVDLDADLDESPRKPVRSVREPRERTAKAPRSKPEPRSRPSKSKNDDPTTVQVALRGGYSPYYSLGFVTVGGEVNVALGDSGVHLMGGVQGWSVQRDIPVQFQRQVGAATEWNTIVPYNAGVVYKGSMADGLVRPYGGADVIAARYFVPEQGGGGSVAFGARARVGADIMFVRAVGLNLDLAVGGWSGSNWDQIDLGVKNAGLLPQFSAGTVIAF